VTNTCSLHCPYSFEFKYGLLHSIRLDPDAHKVCTIMTPLGKYQYLRLPMGISCSLETFQENMSDFMQQLKFVRTHLDDLLIISSSTFNDHLQKWKWY
jgi:hypothetical protein